MKHFPFVTLALCYFATCTFTSVSGQTDQNLYTPDARLYQAMEKSQLESLVEAKSELIIYYNFYLNNSYYSTSLNSEKPITGADIHAVTFNDAQMGNFNEKSYSAETFNAMMYNFSLKQNDFTTYIWNEAGIAIVFLPLSHIQANFQNYLVKNNLSK